MRLLVKGARIWGKEEKDILIEGNRIKRIAERIEEGADEVIDARGMIALPPFFNAHTHAAMALLRGYADDMPLKEWLEEKIWPIEAKMTEEDVYWGTKLACLEMIKSGTLFFNDMYWHWRGIARAVQEMGIRAAVSAVFIDLFDPKRCEEQKRLNVELFERSGTFSSRVIFSLGPHAIYTCSREGLLWCAEFARRHGLMVHIHLSETETEVQDCLKKTGLRPVEYLDRLGFLGPNVVCAHSVWLSEREMDLLAERGVKVVYNPVSNMKLSVGGVFPYKGLKERNVEVLLGTDGCASNNNLDMLQSAKIGSLLQKHHLQDPEALPAEEALQMITISGATAFGIDAQLREGDLADLILIDTRDERLTPGFNLASDLIYSATGTVVDTAICDGKVLMRGRKVEGEEELLQEARRRARELVKR
ncbi:MAG: amidohydrolase [Deltaproteobacteria bacterium]|nr:MAG: amidohydrolase [Deltaproteobacteria bacterium]